jgi:hypothetical protein
MFGAATEVAPGASLKEDAAIPPYENARAMPATEALQIQERLTVLYAQQGNRDAFSRLVDLYDRRLLYFIRRILGGADGALDVLQQEPLDPSEYKEYRMKLENALATAERREKLAGRVALTAFAVNCVLMFVGGSKVFGDFDPWSRDATIWSVTLGVIYCTAAVTWPLALAIGFSRFRPRVREIKEQIRDTSILALQSEIAELRKQISAISRRDDPA